MTDKKLDEDKKAELYEGAVDLVSTLSEAGTQASDALLIVEGAWCLIVEQLAACNTKEFVSQAVVNMNVARAQFAEGLECKADG